MNDLKQITRKEAAKQNLKRFFTGKPCCRGHLAERFTTSQTCVECVKENARKYYRNLVLSGVKYEK